MPGRRKYGPKYVGGCFLLPYDPSSCWNDATADVHTTIPYQQREKTNPKPTLQEFFGILLEILPSIISQVRVFFYILYPVADLSWLRSSSHTSFIFTLYSALNRCVVERGANPMTDIGIYPVFYPNLSIVPYCIQQFTDLQADTLTNLISVNDPSTVKFIERKSADGPVAIFRFLPDDERCRETSLSNLHQCGARDVPLSHSIPNLSEPHRGAPFSNSILQLCHRCDISLQIVDAWQCASESSTATISQLPPHVRPDLSSSVPVSYVTLPAIEQFDSVVIGGTFDHLHVGHKFLLWMLSVTSRFRMTVALVSDDGYLLDNKIERRLVEPFEYRVLKLVEFLQRTLQLLNFRTRLEVPPTFVMRFKSKLCPELIRAEKPLKMREEKHLVFNSAVATVTMPIESLPGDKKKMPPDEPFYRRGMPVEQSAVVPKRKLSLKPISEVEVEIVELLDPIGPAGDRSDFSCLLVTSDTRRGGDIVNEHRHGEGLPPLQLIELPLIEIGELSKENQEQEATEVAPTSSEDRKISSSLVRQQLTSTPIIEDLRLHWDAVSFTLKLPTAMSAVWSIRFLELFSLPWRRRNRSRLHQMLDQLWSQSEPPIQANVKICPTDKAWLSIAFWLSLSIISEEVRSEQWKVEQLIAREKLEIVIRLFCDDYYLAMALALGPKIHDSWRTPDSRLPKLTGVYANFINREIKDLRNNLTCVGEYLLLAFVPKQQRLTAVQIPADRSAGGNPRNVPEGPCRHEDAQLQRLHGNELLHHFQQTIDYFVYEFFQKSYHADYAPLMDPLDSPRSSACQTPPL